MKTTIPQDQQTRSMRSAFTLAEVMVSVLVMAIVFVGLYLGFTQGFAVIQVARENLRATQILEEKTETIRLFNWAQIVAATGGPSFAFTNYFYPLGGVGGRGVAYRGTRTITPSGITDSGYANDLKLVTFQLTWTSGKIQRQRQMRTFVAQYGLHNYIYYGKD
jgi:prepilin-type N-terminal cleavage/methylation domain-containing protein